MAIYNVGDYVKVEFQDEATGISEWMWMRVKRCDEQNQLVFGTLDSEPSTTTTERSAQGQNWPPYRRRGV